MDEFDLLEREGLLWVRRERAARYPRARGLEPAEIGAVERFFRPETLGAARIDRVHEIPNPPFYDVLAERGGPIPLDFRRMSALTLIDCILIAGSKVGRGPIPPGLLFHELVHVAQYRLLGVEEFVRRYVRGWAQQGRDYARIPAEIQAGALAARYEADPASAFSVEAAVAASPP